MIFQLARQGATLPGSTNPEDAEYAAAWRTTLREPVQLPAGSAISLQGAAISSSLDTALSITIDEEITMNCTFLTWVTLIDNKSFRCYKADNSGPDPSGQSYLPAFICGPPLPKNDVPGGGYVVTNGSFKIDAGSYTPQGLAERVTEVTREIIATTGHSGANASPFSIMFDMPQDLEGGVTTGKPLYWLTFEGTGKIGGVLDYHNLAGAYNITLLGSPLGLTMSYDDDIGRVELQYAHLPMQDKSGIEIAVLSQLYDAGAAATNQFELVSDRTGIILTDVGFGYSGQPPWDSPNNIFAILGFEFGDLLLPGGIDEIASKTLQPQRCPSFTRTLRTANLMPFASTEPAANTGKGHPPQVATTGQQGVQASRPPKSFGVTQSPLYLIECDLLPEPLFWCSDGHRRRIIGYVTRELESGGYLYTGLSDEVVLQKSILVSSIGIRMLDPANDFRVVEGLGVTSYVHLSVSTPGGVSPEIAASAALHMPQAEAERGAKQKSKK